jgi:hypothetical protein
MDLSSDILVNIAIQLPLLVLFIWYNDRMLRRFDSIQEKRDEQFLAGINKVTDAIHEHDSRVDDRIDRVRDNTLQRRVTDRKAI